MDDGSCSSSGIKPKRRNVKGKQLNKAKSLKTPYAQEVCAKIEVELTSSLLLGVQ
ncbi:hypothetical protein [Lachnoclostridium phytofermentans]|uniref:hypothetical protein n=1 Tax=Lachnoclostridium phytofermentans TaxID=66219 RepID=UPI0012DEBF49|nr:hypothetical protein [Lachnoclostridium phytofermentans]